MKKFLSLLLAAMMLLSCSVAFASSTNVGNMTDVSAIEVATTVSDDNKLLDGSHFLQTDDHTATQKTDLWLQVDATGQIDVTVPLVVVFKTNIDGGDATEATNYKINNHNNANLVVTKIQITGHNENGDKMTLVNKTDDLLATNSYYVTLKPDNQDETYDLLAGNATDDDSGIWSKNAIEGGLFPLNRTADTAGSEAISTATVLTLDMKTGKLDFVTTRNAEDTQMDLTQGVKLLEINYTVAINTNASEGEKITGKTTGSEFVVNDETKTHQILNSTYDYSVAVDKVEESANN